ncbi:MAG: protoporphyrinogen oxidase [Longimicrobiales bacterium]|nr:protoporphyrinogen oxidase [Longimicrobiales bacterium]
MENNIPTVAVIGGGLAGLTAAHRLLHPDARLELVGDSGRRFECRLVLLERGDRLGGKIVTERFDGFTVEGSADSFLVRKPWARALVEELGLEDDLVACEPEKPRAFVRRSGRLVPFPDGLSGMVPTQMGPLWSSGILSPLGCARVAMEPLIPRRKHGGDETVASFVRRRFGTELYERLMQPLLGGLYGSSPEELSVEATFPVLVEAEKKSGSVGRGLAALARERPPKSDKRYLGAPFISLRNGIGDLIDALETSVVAAGAKVELGTEVTSVRRSEARWVIEFEDRRPLTVDAVVLTLPAPAAARVLPGHPDLAMELGQIPFTSTSVVTAAFKQDAFDGPLKGHGYLNPISESRKVAGVTWSSRKFAGRAPEGQVLLRGFVRDPHLPAAGPKGEEELLAILEDEIRDAVGLTAAPLWWRVFRWESSMPAYTVGHIARVASVQSEAHKLSGLFLAGCSYGGVGIPDTVRSGEDAAIRLMKHEG